MAVDVQPFLGAGVGVSWSKTEENIKTPGYVFIDSGTTKDKDNTTATLANLKGGAVLDKTHRVSLSYSPTFDNEGNIHNFFVGYDYLIPVNNENRFYIGAHAGISNFEGKKDMTDYDMSGFSYGAQAGYIYDITRNIEFELGVIYTKYNLDIDGKRKSVDGSVAVTNLELKYSVGTFVGINYKF